MNKTTSKDQTTRGFCPLPYQTEALERLERLNPHLKVSDLIRRGLDLAIIEEAERLAREGADEPFRTDYEFLKGVDFIFVSLDRNLSGEECHELAEKYFETHKQMTLPGQVLLVDLRPAYRKPLADVTPKFHAISKGYTFTPQR